MRFTRLALALLLVTPAAWAQGGPPGPGAGPGAGPEGGPSKRGRYVDPSSVLASEIAFARLVQQKGQWWAFRKLADPEAQLFVPQRVEALPWLKKQHGAPVPALRWQAQAVWASCGGEIAVTSGPWQQGAVSGTYATVWRRQKKGAYGWLLTMRFTSPAAAAPEMIPALVSDCDGARIGVNAESRLAPGDDGETGLSRDGSLRWTSTVRADGSRRFTLDIRREGQPVQVLDLASPAAP